MPERWEREVSKLRSIEADEDLVRRRVTSGPRPDGRPPRGQRLAAGSVAALVAVAAIALVWRTLPGGPGTAGGAADLPVLRVSFHDSEIVPEGPDASFRRVRTTISYGDAREESHTSTTPPDAIVDWVAVEDLTRFVPGPTAGSAVELQADGDDPRVLIGRLDQWPNFDAMSEIERLPDAPGEYVLVFEATYPEGIARTARRVQLVEPSVLQLVLTEGGESDAATGSAFVDGRRTDGFLSAMSFTEGDAGTARGPEAPTFALDAWLAVPPGSRVVVATPATAVTGGRFESYGAFDPQAPLPDDLLAGGSTIGGSAGRVLLAVEAIWVHVAPGVVKYETSERALFFFPIEVTEPASTPSPIETTPSPSAVVSPMPSPSPSIGPAETILVRVEGLGRSERSREWPVMTVSFGGDTAIGCTEAFEWTRADLTTIEEASGREGSILPRCSYEPLFVVPPGTPIVVLAEPDAEVRPTRTTTPFYAGIDGIGASVTWQDGKADFIAFFEVRYDRQEPVPMSIDLDCPPDDRIPFASPDGPRITPGGATYITGNLDGFRPGDVVEQMTRDPDGQTEWDGTWQVVRTGSVIATVEFGALSGVACRGSGIGGV